MDRSELDAFLWLTPFLRIFIPGRAQLVMTMKEAYQEQVPNEAKPKLPHDNKAENCDQDFTTPKQTYKSKKATVRRK